MTWNRFFTIGLSFLILFSISADCLKAADILSWAKRAGGTGHDGGRGIASYGDGSCVVTGRFIGTATFGEGEANATTLSSSADDDEFFVVKYNSNGTLAWAKHAQGTNYWDYGPGIASYGDGSCVVTGCFRETATFGEGEANETILSADYSDDIFVVRYNSNGTLAWAKRAGGKGFSEGIGIASYADGSCVVTGCFTRTATFGEGEANETSLSSERCDDLDDLFVARYNSNGTLAWAKRAGGTGNDLGRGIASYGDGSCVVTGCFRETATFGKGEANETILFSAGDVDLFVARYNSNGTLAWAKRAGGTDFDEGCGIASYADGSCVVTGCFMETATFCEGEANETSLSSAGEEDIFVARYNSNGTLAWAKRAGDIDWEEGYGIASYADGSCVVTGRTSGNAGMFILKYDTSGALVWANGTRGPSSEQGYGIASYADGSCVVTGGFWGTAKFGEGEVNATNLVSAGDWDIFIAKYFSDYQSANWEIMLNDASFSPGTNFSATFMLHKSIERPCTVYSVIILPSGVMLDTRTLSTNIQPVAKNVARLGWPFSHNLISTVIPLVAPLGMYEIVVVFFDPDQPITGRGDAFLDVNKTFLIQ
jgi:hypothetical protein